MCHLPSCSRGPTLSQSQLYRRGRATRAKGIAFSIQPFLGDPCIHVRVFAAWLRRTSALPAFSVSVSSHHLLLAARTGRIHAHKNTYSREGVPRHALLASFKRQRVWGEGHGSARTANPIYFSSFFISSVHNSHYRTFARPNPLPLSAPLPFFGLSSSSPFLDYVYQKLQLSTVSLRNSPPQ